jgi:hypothetical protein
VHLPRREWLRLKTGRRQKLTAFHEGVQLLRTYLALLDVIQGDAAICTNPNQGEQLTAL